MSYKNFSYSTVATAPSPATSGTSLVVATGDGAKFPATPFNATVWPVGAIPLTSNAEIVRVTNIAGDTFTITRAQEGTSARSIGIGDQICLSITAQTFATDFVHTVSSSGATLTVDATLGNVHDITLTANCTFTLSGAVSGSAFTLTLLLRQDSTGGRTVTWPGAVTWIGGITPILHSGASTFDVITLFTVDGGTTWYGSQASSPAPSFAFAEVLTQESTSSSAYTDLATSGPAATITVGPSGVAQVIFNAQIINSGTTGLVSVAVSGASTVAANDNWCLASGATTSSGLNGRGYVFTGLTPGSTTFTMKYRSSSGTPSFLRRSISAEAK